ncbi:MAG: hypothetical protein ACI81R_003405 [Bradymonadia bacterium]|jgi:hypothetical protein
MSKDRDDRPDEEIEVLDDDLLDEADLDGDVEGDFEDEATTVFDTSVDDGGGFEEELTAIFDTTGAPASGVVVKSAPAQPAASPAQRTAAPIAHRSRPKNSQPAEMPTQVRGPVVQVASPRRITDSTSQQTVVTSVPGSRHAGVLTRVSTQSNAPLIALSLILLAALGILLILLFRPSPVAELTATVAVFSSPADATILVDGVPHHQRTPATLTDLVPGEAVTLELRRDGYQPISELITPGNGLLTREFELLPVPGSVVVRTFPDGAMISLDGSDRGPAPVTLLDLDRGNAYLLTATLQGHEEASRELAWSSNSPSELAVLLTLALTPIVEADGVGVGELGADADASTGAVFDTLPPVAAPAAVTNSAAGASTPSRERAASREPSTTRAPATTPPVVTPRERVGTRPAPPTQDQALVEPPTPAARPSERPSERPPERPAEQVAEQAPEGEGSLSVQALPYGQVYVNGRMVAAETPLINHTLDAGVYTVKVYHVSLRQWSEERTVRIEPSERRTLTFRAQ